MGLTNLMLWVCSLFGASCGVAPVPAPVPNVAIIQSAYEREAASGSALHDKGLKVLEAGCDPPKDGRFLCQITFMSKDDPSQRLYYDVVAVARGSADWELKSGLCKR